MKKRSLTPLGETEMEVLQHVWDLGRATVANVHDRILRKRKIAYTTVMTVMKNLASKKYLEYEKEGVTYVYRAVRPAGEVQKNVLQGIVDKVFRGSPAALIQTLVQSEDISEEQRAEIRRLIEEMGREEER